MKHRFKIIALLATVTVTGILIFQIYWVYNTYKTGERNFNTTVLNAMQKGIDRYPLTVSKLPTDLTSKNPTLSLVTMIPENVPMAIKDNSDHSLNFRRADGSAVKLGAKSKMSFMAALSKLPVSSANLFAVQQLVAQLLTEQSKKPINLDALGALIKVELQRDGITLPFKLVVLTGNKKTAVNQLAVPLSFVGNNALVAIELTNKFQFLLAQNVMPSVVSLLLILLSGGSLIYMGLIINRQMQLDGLKNDFINNITHELRTPIAILRSSSESLLKFGDLNDTDKTIRHLNINLDILDKLDKNVDRILDITRYEHGIKSLNFELINVDQLVESIIGRFGVREELSIRYQSELTTKLISTDAYIIDTVINNLIDNAVKYSDRSPEIIITTSPLAGNGWQIQVADNGIGISDNNIPYIFDKFYRVNSGNLHDVKGYGLGLSYVKQLINSLNGSIGAKSKLGIGTTFTIKLPGHE